MTQIKSNDTANKILDIAEHYTQTRGFNAFSYRDIQNDLGIKTPSIHYHFPTKQDLALCMIDRYLERYQLTLKNIEKSNIGALKKLKKLADIFMETSRQNKFCVCGMLAADIVTMPEEMSKRLDIFFKVSEEWIARIIRKGKRDKIICASIKPEHAATHFLATLEGGLLIARINKRPRYLSIVINELFKKIAI